MLDGTGADAVRADIGMKDGKIADVGNLTAAEAAAAIDAGGLVVCPGFIDAHSHSDTYLLLEPSSPSKLYQGITTEIVGNCGTSAAPRAGNATLPSDWQDLPYPGEWRTVAEYRSLLEKVRPAVNVVLMIGHNTLRRAVAATEDRALTPDELRDTSSLLDQALDEGGRGFSTGLIYAPGMFAPRNEITHFAGIAARRHGVYTSHMRSEGARLLEAIDETIEVGRSTGIRVEISHLKTSGEGNWRLLDATLERIHAALASGISVAADRYPYTAGSTDLDVVLPAWAHSGGREALLKRLRTAADIARMRDEMIRSRPDERAWQGVTIASTSHPDNLRFRGRPLLETAAALRMAPVDAILHLIATDELRTSAFFFGMSEQNMFRILAEPWVMLGTDASLRSTAGILSKDFPHPRAFGSFPKFLRWAIDGRTVPLPEAVRKMTSLPAGHFGLANRGRIAPGMHADVVVFDPATVRDRADYSTPHAYSEGIRHVIVNGILTISNGNLTGNRAGRMI